MAILLLMFFPNPPLLARLFRQCWSNDIQNKNKNKLMWESYFFLFRTLKNNIICFFIINTFISNTTLRLIWNNKHSKRRTCWVKSITATKSIHYSWKTVLTSFSIDNPLLGYNPPLYLQEDPYPLLLWFFKYSNPSINKEVYTMNIWSPETVLVVTQMRRTFDFDQPCKQTESKMQVTGKISSNK